MPIYRGDGGSGEASTNAYASQVAQDATNAAQSALDAATSEGNAAASAVAAGNAQTAAETAQTAAETAQGLAEAAQLAAETAEANAAASFDDFDDRYLGGKASDPTLDNDGDALLAGALYYNTVALEMRVYNGTAWDILNIPDAIGDISDVTITSPTSGQVLKYNGAVWINDTDTDTGILYTDLSVTTNPVGSAALAYNNTNGVFTYTPPDLSTFITASSTDTLTNKSGNISQWTNDSNYLTSFTETNDLTAAVTWANVPDLNITQSSVTQHQAALSITESQISDLGIYLLDGDTVASLTINSADINGGTIDGTSIGATLKGNGSFNELISATKATFQSEIVEQQYSLTGTAIDPSNGTIQYKTLSANTTFTEVLADGEYVTLMIDDGTGFTVTWPTTTWVGGSAPTLETTGYNIIELWHINGVLYGAFIGAA